MRKKNLGRIRGGKIKGEVVLYPPIDQPEYYIHAPKVAGTAISQSLGIKRTHDPATYIKDVVGPLFDTGRKIFGSIRNPWDRALSWFLYNHAYRKEYAPTKSDFNRWIAEGMSPAYNGTRDARLLYQEDFIEIDGECILGFIVHFERLHEEWMSLLLWLNRKFIALKYNDNKPWAEKPDYREWFTTESIKITVPNFEYFAKKYGYAYGDEPGHVYRARIAAKEMERIKEGVTSNEMPGTEL